MKFTIFAMAAAFVSFAAANPLPGGPGGHGGKWPKKGYFTSTYSIVATPDQVINMTNIPAPGQPGATGYFKFGINSKDEVICYDIVLKGVTGPYQSAARTATHIHAAVKGLSGPPRIAFPNPVGDDKYRRSKGCLTGPFTTGINVTGTSPPVDTGAGFSLTQIEANPAGFFCDTHTRQYVPGAVRGQLA